MSRLTVLQGIGLVRRAMGNPTSGNQWPNTDILYFINQAQLNIAQRFRPEYLTTVYQIDTVVDQLHYDLPEDYLQMITIVNLTVKNNVRPIDARLYATENQGVRPTGPVIEWWEDEGLDDGTRRIAVRLIPDRVQELEIRYLRKPVDATLEAGGEDSFLYMPEEYDLLVLREAAALGLSFDFQVREASNQMSMSNVTAQDVMNIRPRPPVVWHPFETPIAKATRRDKK